MSLVSAAALFACSSSSKAPANAPPTDAGAAVHGDEVTRTYAPTYTAVWNEILTPQCAVPFCHVGLGVMPLSVGKDQAYSQQLVNVPASGPMCTKTGMKRVDPGNPSTSLLYQKLTNAPCGAPMPYAGRILPEADLMQISTWIEQGAPNN